jgi:hypothetical protein
VLDLLPWIPAVVVGLTGLLVVADALRLGAPPMPSSPAARRALVAMLPDRPGLEAHELGAGWGGLAVAVARARPTWQVVAWEAAWVPFAFLWIRRRIFGPRNLTVRRGDWMQAPLEQCDVITAYLLPDAMLRLRDALEARGRPGAWLLSVHFGVRGWSPDRASVLRDRHRTRVLRYRVPA